jgi:hypothetical protein
MAERAVVVCTDKRGVFFGYSEKTDGDAVRLKKSRMCVYWSSDVRGVMGLAANGPTKDCRISPAVPEIEVRGITAIMECSEAATAAWEKAPWSS